jgi:hypothetical protein
MERTMTDQESSEALDLQRELLDLRKENANLRLIRQANVILLGMIARYQRAIKSTGAILAEEEVALVEAIRKGGEL